MAVDFADVVRTAYNALNDKKGIDIKVIDIQEISVIADYFIIAGASNVNQVKALVDNVQEELVKCGYHP
ncbi:MAG: RsfS/YbeB/iojap family protein, partial [Eubacterium sp.]